MRVASVNGNKYILVIVDDYSRFIRVKFLRSKDEAPDFIIKFLKMIQVRLKVTARRIRTDNGTEFVNQTLREYYENIGISHETYVARSLIRTDISKITRKPSKTGKHGHENGRVNKSRKPKPKPEKVKSTVNSSQFWSTKVNKTQNVSK
ncbi:retrovirus-related pol polyprotein from transposon TNT 1-94 [Tanacetum coccineum]